MSNKFFVAVFVGASIVYAAEERGGAGNEMTQPISVKPKGAEVFQIEALFDVRSGKCKDSKDQLVCSSMTPLEAKNVDEAIKKFEEVCSRLKDFEMNCSCIRSLPQPNGMTAKVPGGKALAPPQLSGLRLIRLSGSAQSNGLERKIIVPGCSLL